VVLLGATQVLPACRAVIAVTIILCPDCPAMTSGDGQLVHEKTCSSGRVVDERIAADQRWFAEHPWAREYRRPPDWTETAEARMLGVLTDGEVIRRTLGRYPTPGLVVREIGGVMLVASVVAR
jgi:hypothetical protein